ncbi:MAG TPA: DUF3426 domain-containing protein [Burkholderiales bacterium]|nr:DUF3426 domain-containing protein [Burkholderiales bacterium]
MITRCPFCQTHFRVHAEQLSARAGQVRCGKCNRVFDALEHLVEGVAPVHEHAAVHTDTGAAERVPEEAENVIPEVQEPANEASPVQEVETILGGAGAFEATTPTLEPAQPASIEPWAAPGADAFDFGPAVDTAERARRWPWLLGALLLLLLLLAQAAYYYRSAIIVLVPRAKPYAVALCATLHCDLPLPRRIDLMSIEASDLQADTTNPNIMVLSATLKNRAIFDQQYPMLELTLTDPQDQPVVRRVLAPRDYLGKDANVRAGFPANSETAIKVFIEGSQVKATGYRLYLFYP